MQRSRSLGQYFTPPLVVDLAFEIMVWLQPQLDKGQVLDLSCGEGAFLEGARRAGFDGAQLYGLDADARLRAAWRSQPALVGAHFAVSDGLVGDGEALFEVVVGNPPFGGAAEAEHDVHLAWQYQWWRLGGRRRAALPRELWFLERSLRLLRPQGLLAMVLPEGVLANRRWRAQREVLVRDCQIEAIVGLPRSVFSGGGAAVKTVLLVLRKGPPAPEHRVRLAELGAAELGEASATLLSEWQLGRSLAGERPWA